ncbi:MAG: DUF1080 domain-containing protein [Planctomycetes bacterium]|nr:DUF1080 domain-containing protein [Planctomycetota bacterium]
MRIALILLVNAAALTAQHNPGYTDTPKLPSGWRVHDSERPHPPVVDPGPAPAEPLPVPSDAIVLFDGRTLDAWEGNKGAAKWAVQDGYMEVNGTGDIHTKQEFGDCQLHVEWASPAEVKGDSQGRGNSGIFLLGRYEVQVLDSYENVTYADGQAAALYGQHPPLVNACRAPGQWQTYDIVFRAPRFKDDGALESPARVTVLHNGVLVQDAQEYWGPSAHRSLPHYEKHPSTGQLRLQDHGNPVHYRNIWIRPL